jgi:hypothetical protein
MVQPLCANRRLECRHLKLRRSCGRKPRSYRNTRSTDDLLLSASTSTSVASNMRTTPSPSRDKMSNCDSQLSESRTLLIHELTSGTPHTWVEAMAWAFFQNTPFYAVSEMLSELLAWHGNESAEEQLTQLEKPKSLTQLEREGLVESFF